MRGATDKYPRVNSLRPVLVSGSITEEGNFTSGLSKIVTDKMYVPSTKTVILLRDCSHIALVEPLERYAKYLNSSIGAKFEKGHNTSARRQLF